MQQVFKRFIIGFFIFSQTVSPAFASIILKVSAQNPSQLSEREVTLKSYLPKEITPDNVVDLGGLSIAYDMRKGQYYVTKTEVLDKQQSVSYNVEIEDIWVISQARLDRLKKHTQDLIDKLKFTQYFNDAKVIQEEIDRSLEAIKDSQDQNDVMLVSPAQHIGAYLKNLTTLEKVKENIGILEKLILVTDGNPGSLMGERSITTTKIDASADQDQKKDKKKKQKKYRLVDQDTCVDQEELKDQNGVGVFGQNNRISIFFNVENPSSQKSTTLPVKYLLPKEIQAEDVYEAQGLDVSYDFSQEQYYVYNDSITLEPGETRIFEIVVKDKWLIDKTEVLAMKLHLESLIVQLKKLGEDERATDLKENVLPKIYTLLDARSADQLTKEHVEKYYKDQGLFDEVKKKVFLIEDVLAQRGVKPEVFLVDDEILCEEMQAAREDKTIVQNLIKRSKTPDILKRAIFQQKAPDRVTLWRIIFGIIVALGAMSYIFFAVWSAQSSKETKYKKINTKLDAKDKKEPK